MHIKLCTNNTFPAAKCMSQICSCYGQCVTRVTYVHVNGELITIPNMKLAQILNSAYYLSRTQKK